MKPQERSAVIEFPKERARPSCQGEGVGAPAEVVIFPGVRIERLAPGPQAAAPQKRPG